MTHVLGRVFLAATLFLPLWRGDGHTTGAARGEGVDVPRVIISSPSRGEVSRSDGGEGAGLVHSAHATTSTITTKKIKDAQLGEVIQIGTSKFVKIAPGKFMAATLAELCNDDLTIGGSKNFAYTGGEQTFTACAGRSYKMEVWGAQGGSCTAYSGDVVTGGLGGYSAGTYITNVNQQLFINVGGQGTSSTSNYSMNGGYNGGGNSGIGSNANYGRAGGGGGGATHIATATGLLGSVPSAQVLLVAGAGGGAGGIGWYTPSGFYVTRGKPGAGGGSSGENGVSQSGESVAYGGGGGTQSAGGSAGAKAPDCGLTTGPWTIYPGSGGGGGGGFYGGGGGGGGSRRYELGSDGNPGRYGIGGAGGNSASVATNNRCFSCGGGGGGGSGYIGGVTSGTNLAGTQSFASPDGGSETGHTGHGAARITRLN